MAIAPNPVWQGMFVSSNQPDRSNGQNPRYSVANPLRKFGETDWIHKYDNLKVGDVVRMLWVRRYQHGATMQIVKINSKTIKAVELERSYGHGTVWTINKNFDGLYLASEYMSVERLTELASSGY